jgi:ABC-type Mn2+/Zn2+ transport system permease subunit
MLAVGVASAVGATVVGLWVSYRFDVAAGATIVLVLAAGFGVSLAVARGGRGR